MSLLYRKLKRRKGGNPLEKKTESVYAVMQAILAKLTAQSESSATKALLAVLRHSAGKPLGNVPSVWPLLFTYMPESFLSNNGEETKRNELFSLPFSCMQCRNRERVAEKSLERKRTSGKPFGRSRQKTMIRH